MLRYDNETGKGDHRHIREKQYSCVFTTPEQLIADFQRDITMETVILDVRAPAEAMADLPRVWRSGNPERAARISFASPELLWQALTAKRWQLLKALCGAGPMSIREAARRVGRDVKAFHRDVTALLNAGLMERDEGGVIVFPFEAVKVEFVLQPA